MRVLFLSLFFVVGCVSTRPIHIDPEKVEAWSYELGAKEPFQSPFLSHFSVPGHELYYLAAHHGNHLNSPTFRLAKLAFERFPIGNVLIEGYPNVKGPSSPSYATYVKKTCDSKFCEGGEPAYSTLLAIEKGIPYEGVEPSEAMILKSVNVGGYSSNDLVAFYVLRQIAEWKRQGKLSRKAVGVLVKDFVDYERDELKLPGTFSFAYPDLRKWYRDKNKKELELLNFDNEEVAPLPQGPLFTNRLSSVVGEVRDREILKVLTKRMNEHRQVFLVMGHSHLAVQRKAIENAFGPPLKQIPAPAVESAGP